jgi:hypothetical protein
MATVITTIGDQILTEDADAHFARIAAEKQAAAERVRARHVANLMRISMLSLRQEYLANLTLREGKESADLTRAEFAAAWQRRDDT